MDLSLPQIISVVILPLIFAITLHEAAHGWVAKLCGDRTAYLMGRVTLNPKSHIDWLGTVAVPLFSVVIASVSGLPPVVFGWAKPVPIDVRNFRSWRRDQALVALAGPMSNVLMACVWALVAKVSFHLDQGTSLATFLHITGFYGILINLMLAVLNLVPLPPLDGSRVLAVILPPRAAAAYKRLEPYGLWILLALIMTGILQRIIFPFVAVLRDIVRAITGV